MEDLTGVGDEADRSYGGDRGRNGDGAARGAVGRLSGGAARGARGGHGSGAARGANRGRVEKHTVYAVFGTTEKGPDVWLFVKSSGQKVQYLTSAADGSGLWTVLAGSEDQTAVVRKQWKRTAFHVSGRGRGLKVTTVSPFDATELAALAEQCKLHVAAEPELP